MKWFRDGYGKTGTSRKLTFIYIILKRNENENVMNLTLNDMIIRDISGHY